MTVNEFLQKYRKLWDIGVPVNVTRPRVKCADGFTVSVQAGCGIYSTPAKDADEYTAVELGFPSEDDDLIKDYHDTGVYPQVPVELVDMLFKKHGGIVGADFSNTSGSWENMNGGAE